MSGHADDELELLDPLHAAYNRAQRTVSYARDALRSADRVLRDAGLALAEAENTAATLTAMMRARHESDPTTETGT